MKRALFVTVQMFALACVSQSDPRLKKVEELDKAITALSNEVKDAQSTIGTLQTDVTLLQLGAEPYKSATFDPGNPGGYQRIDTTGGTFLVSFQNAVPYVDGFKVTCNFGNPSSGTFNGFKLKAKWGPRFDRKDKSLNYAQWQASLREKELSLTDSLKAASWNPVSFVLSPAKPDAFGYLELSMDTDNVSLRK